MRSSESPHEVFLVITWKGYEKMLLNLYICHLSSPCDVRCDGLAVCPRRHPSRHHGRHHIRRCPPEAAPRQFLLELMLEFFLRERIQSVAVIFHH